MQQRVSATIGTATSSMPNPANSTAVHPAAAPPITVTARHLPPRVASATATLSTLPLAPRHTSLARLTSPASRDANRMIVCQAGDSPAATTGPE